MVQQLQHQQDALGSSLQQRKALAAMAAAALRLALGHCQAVGRRPAVQRLLLRRNLCQPQDANVPRTRQWAVLAGIDLAQTRAGSVM